ncbi:hypothetical protein QYF36_011056 [Acer negundo]|nr:hypothetical protein QYF36_011056 [Acer negundo]
MADTRWRDTFGQAIVEHFGFNSSDRQPVLLRQNRVVPCQRRNGGGVPFIFEPFWLKEVDIVSMIQSVWVEAGNSNSMTELKCNLSRVTTRRKRNFIEKLTDNRGIVQSGELKLASVIQGYFSTIFKSSTPSP